MSKSETLEKKVKEHETGSSLKHEMLDAIKTKMIEKAEGIFLEIVEKELDNASDCLNYAEAFKKIGKGKKFAELAAVQFAQLHEKKQYAKIYELAKAYNNIITESEDFIQPVVTAIQEVYKNNPNIKRYMRVSGLLAPKNLKENLKEFERFIYCDEGEIFEHHSWGVGVVTDVNTLEKKVTIDFQNQRGKVMAIDGVFEFLRKIPGTHFKGMKIKNPEALRKMILEESVDFIKKLLRENNNKMKSNELRDYFVEVMPSEKWNDWWKNAKNALRFDTQIELKEGIQMEITLREEHIDFYDELMAKVRNESIIVKKCAVIRTFAKHKNHQPPTDVQIANLLDYIKEEFLKNQDINPSAQVEYSYIFKEMAESFKKEKEVSLPATDEDIIKASQSLPELILKISSSEYQMNVCKKIMEFYPGDKWKEIFSETLIHAPIKLTEFLGDTLLKNEGIDFLNHSARTIYEDYEKNPETFVWLVREILTGNWENVSTTATHADLLLEIIHYLELLRHRQPSLKKEDLELCKKLQSQIRAIINEKKFATVKRVYERCSSQDARRIYDSFITSPALTSAIKYSLQDSFRGIRKDIQMEEEKKAEKEVAQSFYVTKQAYENKQKELENILTVLIPENSKDIQVAREKGDLRENAEYDAAKEKQGLLVTQSTELKEQLQRAKIIDPQTIGTESVMVGNKCIVFNNTKQREENYTILGPWDADLDRYIISYLSPFGNQFLNRKIGEKFKVTHPGGGESEYEIKSIEIAVR